MDNLFSYWSRFMEFMEENGSEIIKNPITWILITVVIVGIYGLYDVPNKTKQNGLGNIIRQFIQVILDTSGDLLNALRSLMGFISVLRLLLFGKLNNRTLYILINYAIIFLSMASFVTTYNGLVEIADFPLPAFISFGIQVSILIYSTNIQRLFFTNVKNINTKTKTKYFLASVNNVISYGKNPDANDSNNAEKKDSKGRKEKPGIGIFLLCILLAVSVLISSFFSYVFMFRKFIEEQLIYDDHFRSISVAHEISNEYSEDISIYMSEIRKVLSLYNDKVEEWLDIRNNNPIVQQQQLVDLNSEIQTKQNEMQEQLLIAESVSPDSSEYSVAYVSIERLENEIDDLEKQIDSINNTTQSDSKYLNQLMAYKSILTLTEFYGNPLYLVSEDASKVRESFTNLQQAEASFRETTEASNNEQFNDESAIKIQSVFESYLSLNEYFSQKNKAGVDFSEITEIFGKIEYDEDMSEMDYRDVTNSILEKMIEIMNEIPMLDSVENVWTGEIIRAPQQVEYLNRIYDLYRDNSGGTKIFERAINKLFGLNSEKFLLSLELVIIALAIDLSIVWLTLLRGRKNYTSSTSDLRRLMGILLMDDSMDRESEKYHREQSFCMTIGVVSGILVFALYKISESGRNVSEQVDIFSFLFFILMGLAMSLLVYKIYRKLSERKQKWENEILYLKWKEIWTNCIGDEKELQKRIEAFKNGRLPNNIELNEEDIKSITRLWSGQNEEPVFKKHFYKNVNDLLKELEMKECIKITMIQSYKDKELITVNYISEKCIYPCLSESKVREFKLSSEFSLLKSRKLIAFDNDMNKCGYFILPERFWSLLYDAILLRVVGGRISEWDIEEELHDDVEEEEE